MMQVPQHYKQKSTTLAAPYQTQPLAEELPANIHQEIVVPQNLEHKNDQGKFMHIEQSPN